MDNRARRTLYLVAGMYIFYLGIKLIISFTKGVDGNPIVSLVGGILFLACGIVLIVDYIRKTKKAVEEKYQDDVIEGEATEVEPEEKKEE